MKIQNNADNDSAPKGDYNVLFFLVALLVASYPRKQQNLARFLTDLEDHMVNDLTFSGLNHCELHKQFEKLQSYFASGYGGRVYEP